MDPLFVDLYAGDGRSPEDVARLLTVGPPWHGVALKATEGLYYRGDPWFSATWRAAAAAAHGTPDRWITAYHYFSAHQDPVAQAHAFLIEVERAGGWGHRAIYPVVDVESGNQRKGTTAQQVIDGVTEWTGLVSATTGRHVVLYGGSWLRDLGVHDRMGCEYVWPARYTATLPASTYTSLGFDLKRLFAWQGVGDGEGYWKGYPTTTPIGPEDISAITIDGGGEAALRHLRRDWPVA